MISTRNKTQQLSREETMSYIEYKWSITKRRDGSIYVFFALRVLSCTFYRLDCRTHREKNNLFTHYIRDLVYNRELSH